MNITVEDPSAFADALCQIFDWSIRWEGPSMTEGRTVHVGTEDRYLAVYSEGSIDPAASSYRTVGGLNHVGVLVDDLDELEQRVIAAGFKPFNHQTYDPGSRFYFYAPGNIEFEVVSYS